MGLIGDSPASGMETPITIDGTASPPVQKQPKDHTERMLKARHVQLLGIGGVIGTLTFVGIGKTLIVSGPASLLIAFIFWCTVVLALTNCISEMVSYLPISSPFITFAGRYVDDAFEAAVGLNFFLLEAFLVPFEIVSCNIIIQFWTDSIPIAAVIVVLMIVLSLANVFGVKYFGTTEFWLAMGKIILFLGLTFYTIVTMSGGNPTRHAYGFENWYKPAPFLEYHVPGPKGVFLGFLKALSLASVTITGPEYVSMTAGEVEFPRRVMPRAFKAVFWRLGLIFVVSALTVGIVVPPNSKELAEAYGQNGANAAASPYVVSMRSFGIPVLPHIVNALLFTSAFSAGNGYFFCATRTLYGLALAGKVPRIFARTTEKGVPIYPTVAVLVISCVAFLQVGSGASVVFSWLISLVTSGQLINSAACCVVYLRFRKAYMTQGVPRENFPYMGYLQPYSAYYGIFWTVLMAFVSGFDVFLKGHWDLPTFLFSYFTIGLFPVVYIMYKLTKRPSFIRSKTADLRTGLETIELHESTHVPKPSR
ncbi:related to carnitine transporter [Cephalotrichum gorgonifer]|uniref:Related to carnitine transporter n=1 Tax=Cephalotrichum gorgonifer TaxID=2041049 RepID=A0AAE8MS70_9PEZI|nr:related to carnitine transporter [Cephalotrichum gorgonifer]